MLLSLIHIYSRKFREEHEQEILLHQAAKNAFDEMGVKKLPKVKDLQDVYKRQPCSGISSMTVCKN